MAYPVASLPDGSIKMSDGTVQPPKGAIAPNVQTRTTPSFLSGIPSTSSEASFVNKQKSIAESIIWPSVAEKIRSKTAVSAELPKENEPMLANNQKDSYGKHKALTLQSLTQMPLIKNDLECT